MSKENSDTINMSTSEKKCFIITPIGEENSPTRRHIDGIIDACIEPVLRQKKYSMDVSHRISTPGSINNQILTAIYSYDLAIANLTKFNPNVMYELAFRHSVNKPVIMIMEKNSQRLPFDISGERTIFYINDSQGTIKLKEDLINVIDSIEKDKSGSVDNPIYNAIKDIQENSNVLESIEKEVDKSKPQQTDTLKFILNKITNIENTLNNNSNSSIIKNKSELQSTIIDLNMNNIKNNIMPIAREMFLNELESLGYITIIQYSQEKSRFKVQVQYFCSDGQFRRQIDDILERISNRLTIDLDAKVYQK